jgi:hypothetical protein
MKIFKQFNLHLALLVPTCGLLLCANLAHADGISDLRVALNRLQAQTPIKAFLDVKNLRKRGEGKEAEETAGHIFVAVEDSQRGLQINYSRETLNKLEIEAKAKSKDKETKTPTRNASSELESEEIGMMLSAVPSLQRQIDSATFKGEKAENYNGKPARLLSFEFTIDRLTAGERKYIKSYDSKLEIWIGADGTPLASRHYENGSGRAFLVVSFQQNHEKLNTYSTTADRLLIIRRESTIKSSGAGESADIKAVKTLQVQS